MTIAAVLAPFTTVPPDEVKHETGAPRREPHPGTNGGRRLPQLLGRRRDRARELGAAHEVGVDRRRAGTALGDGPHDQALAATHVAGDEDVLDVGGPLRRAGDVAAAVDLDA